MRETRAFLLTISKDSVVLKVIFERILTLILFQANANGTVLQSEIVGTVKMRVYLTGMPELRLGLNDKVLFEGSGREFRDWWTSILASLVLSLLTSSTFNAKCTLLLNVLVTLFVSSVQANKFCELGSRDGYGF